MQAGTCFTHHHPGSSRQPHEHPASHSTQPRAGRELHMIARSKMWGSGPGQPLAVQ